MAEASTRELVVTRIFDAPPALLFDLWVDPKHLGHWWGPKAYPMTRIEMDVRPGGAWRGLLTGRDDGAELWQGGVFREVAPPHRLVFTFAWDAPGERGLETLVTVDFADEGGKTRMTFRQTPFQSSNEREGHRDGWSSCFDRLDDYVAHYRADA